MKRLKVAYLTVNDPLDKRSWSGITYYLGQALQRHVGEVDFLGPVHAPPLLDKTLRGIAKLIRMVSGKEYNTKHSLLFAWYSSRELKRRMKGKQYDVVVAPGASTEFAFFRSPCPSVYFSDTTFKLISGFYKKEYAQIPGISHWEGNLIERKAIHNASFIIYSSHWAGRSAVADYGADPSRIVMSPFGANMDFDPGAGMIFRKRENPTLTLLFLAVDWERKGGPIAFETLEELHRRGVNARLIVCGCTPPPEFRHPGLEVIPFLNKNLETDHERFVEILSTSHFLLVPTRADCSLIVACESNAYGMPAISACTGGVPDLVLNDVNGYCLPFEARGAEYAAKILEIYNDTPRYEALIRTSRAEFEQKLNWEMWTQRFSEEFAKRISGVSAGEKKSDAPAMA